MTAQIPESLILDGEERPLVTHPPLPLTHPRIERADASDRAVDGLHELALLSTACWRGYQGTWTIRDGVLYLVGLRGCVRLRGRAPLLADWYSGVLRVADGRPLREVRGRHAWVLQDELHLTIERGRLTLSSWRPSRLWLVFGHRPADEPVDLSYSTDPRDYDLPDLPDMDTAEWAELDRPVRVFAVADHAIDFVYATGLELSAVRGFRLERGHYVHDERISDQVLDHPW